MHCMIDLKKICRPNRERNVDVSVQTCNLRVANTHRNLSRSWGSKKRNPGNEFKERKTNDHSRPQSRLSILAG